MAATTSPLVWDFYRQLSGDIDLGGVVHYYDEMSQSLYLDGGELTTRVANVPDGHWEESSLGSRIFITSGDDFTNLRLDHPSNGTVYGVASDGTNLTFLRYVYGMDISQLTDSWSWDMSLDNPIYQLTAEVMNIDSNLFVGDVTLFQPGARLTLGVCYGNSVPYQIGIAWLDECSYDISEPMVEISGRNSVGYFLKDQTFDNDTDYNGGVVGSFEDVRSIFQHAKLPHYVIEEMDRRQFFRFKPSDSYLDGLQEMMDAFTDQYTSGGVPYTKAYEIYESPNGTVYVGYDRWMSTYRPNTSYVFNEGRDIFKRKTKKAADGCYTAIRVTGVATREVTDDEGNVSTEEYDLDPVMVNVNNFDYWSLGVHRTKHLQAPDGHTQNTLQIWAEAQAAAYQYVGVGEDFSGPLRPNLLVGDVATIANEDNPAQGTDIGLITEITHSFSSRNGFKTNFNVDTGGVSTDGTNYIVYTRAGKVNGLNRRTKIMDIVRYAINKGK